MMRIVPIRLKSAFPSEFTCAPRRSGDLPSTRASAAAKSSEELRPAPRHQVYDAINETIEANEIPPEKWYPKGHMPEMVREWLLNEDIKIPNPTAGTGSLGFPWGSRDWSEVETLAQGSSRVVSAGGFETSPTCRRLAQES